MEVIDSVNGAIDLDDVANDIYLSICGSNKYDYIAILVEGISDQKFLNKYAMDHVDIQLPTPRGDISGGGSKIDKLIGKLNGMIPNEKRIIVIKDRDYKLESSDEKYFYYDYNSLETFLFSIESVLDGISSEFCIDRKCKKQFREDILKSLKELGIMRKLSEKHKWRLSFKNLPLHSYFDCDKNMLNIDKLLDLICKKNNNIICENPDIIEVIKKEITNDLNYEQLLEIIQGHDLVAIIKCKCDKVYNDKYNDKKEFSKELIESTMRTSCTIDDFSNTNMYKNVKKYENKYGLNILKEL